MSVNQDYQDILEALNHGTCMDGKDRDIIRISVDRIMEELKKRVKVVFCKDCTLTYATRITGAHKCKIWGHQPSPNGFCHRGRPPKVNKLKKEA